MLRPIRALFALVLLVPLAACLVELKTPLSDPSQASYDEKLIGIWRAEKDGERIEIVVTPNKALAGTMNIRYSESKNQTPKPRETLSFRAWRASIGGRNYLTLVPSDGKVAQSGRQFAVFYEIKGDGLEFALMRELPVADAIRAGKLEGTFAEKPHVSKVVVSAPRAKFAAFIAENHAALFGETIALKRFNPR